MTRVAPGGRSTSIGTWTSAWFGPTASWTSMGRVEGEGLAGAWGARAAGTGVGREGAGFGREAGGGVMARGARGGDAAGWARGRGNGAVSRDISSIAASSSG